MAKESVTIPIKEIEISDEERPPDEIMAIDPPEPAEPEPEPTEPVEPTEQPQPKKKGRPVGSKSKEPGKPRAKRVPKKPLDVAAVAASIEATDTVRIESDDLPRVLHRSQPIPQYSHDDTSELLLRLLSHQATQRKRNKVELWKSWFK